jgi:hypothetical protein
MVQELMQLTHTAKYRWLCPPRRRARYQKMNLLGLTEKKNREYL